MINRIWRFLWDEPADPRWNMAVDEAIALSFDRGTSGPTLRLYRWDRPALSLGAFQKIPPDCTPIEPSPMLVRRVTGGRSLYHHHDLTYAVIAGTNAPPFSEGIIRTYHAIANGLLIGLTHLGVPAQMRVPSKTAVEERPWLCFDVTSRYEITACGKKLIGSAQRRFRHCFLQHGSLGIEKTPPPFLSPNQITLAELLPKLPSLAAIRAAFQQGFEKALDRQFENGTLNTEERSLANTLYTEKCTDGLCDRVDIGDTQRHSS